MLNIYIAFLSFIIKIYIFGIICQCNVFSLNSSSMFFRMLEVCNLLFTYKSGTFDLTKTTEKFIKAYIGYNQGRILETNEE